MKLLLDSHALIWWLSGDARLPASARGLLSDAQNDVYVSAASAWEITTKHRIGKLPGVALLAADFDAAILKHGLLPLSITVRHGQLGGSLAGVHKDPFDRILIAQALIESMTLISNEKHFDAYGVARMW